MQELEIKHGYEDPKISDQEWLGALHSVVLCFILHVVCLCCLLSLFVAVDVEALSLVATNAAYSVNARDAVCLKYVVDTRIDEVWQNYLLKIFTELKSNLLSPYALFMNELWQACMKYVA